MRASNVANREGEELLTMRELAEKLKVSYDTVRDHHNAGRIRGIQVSAHRVRFLLSEAIEDLRNAKSPVTV